ncbi:MAG: hypothetical protein ACTHY4_04350 [Flavobacteriaceae bacterium]
MAKINKFTNVKSYPNDVFNKFSDEVYKIETENTSMSTKEDCCRHSSYGGCIECTASNVVGIFVLAFFDGEGAVAIAVSCIGAGPNASC